MNSTDDSGRNIMHWASSGGHANILSFCLEQGTDPDIRDEARWTPLIIASSAGHENCVHLLLGKYLQCSAVGTVIDVLKKE